MSSSRQAGERAASRFRLRHTATRAGGPASSSYRPGGPTRTERRQCAESLPRGWGPRPALGPIVDPSAVAPGPVSVPAVAAATPASIPATPEPAAVAVARLPDGRGQRERGRDGVHVDLFLDRIAASGQLVDRLLPAEVEPPLAIDLDRLHHDLVAEVHDLLNALHAMVGQARDVDQAVLVGKHLDECAKRHDPDDLAPVDAAHLDLVSEALDPVDRLASAALVGGRDEDLAVILDVDLRPGLLHDLADDLTARPDHVPNLVRVDLDRRDPRRVRAHLPARLRNDLEHPAKHEEPSLSSLLQRLRHHLAGEPLDLDVHLQCSDSVRGTRDLEVHVAERDFDTLDVRQDRVAA